MAGQPRGDRGGERRRRQVFYTHQDYAIDQANRLFGFTLPREDFRVLEGGGHQRHLDGIRDIYDSYAADWNRLCQVLPALAAVVPVSKGGAKGAGKGKGKGKAKPQPTSPATPASGSRDTAGTPARIEATPLTGAGGAASSTGVGPAVAAPKVEGAAPPAAAAKAEGAAPAAGEAATTEEAPASREAAAPEATAEEEAAEPVTASDVLPKEEPQLGGDDDQGPVTDAHDQGDPGSEEPVVAEVAGVKEEAPDDTDAGAAEDLEVSGVAHAEGEEEEPVVEECEVDEPVHSSPPALVVHSPASPNLSERAFSEPPERPVPEGRLRVRPRILKPPTNLPPGSYPTVRVDRQGIWILVSPAQAPEIGTRDAEVLPDAAPESTTAGAATEEVDPYDLPQAVWADLALAYSRRPASLDLATAPVVSDRQGERTAEGFSLGVGAFRPGEVIEARPSSPARSRSPRQPATGAAPSAPSRVRTVPAPPAAAATPAPPPTASTISPPAVPPPPAVPSPPPTEAPTADPKGPPAIPSKAAPSPPPHGSTEPRSHPDQGAHAIGAADRSRSPTVVKPRVKAPPPLPEVPKQLPFKAAPTERLQQRQLREQQAQARARLEEAAAQRRREEAAAKAPVAPAPRQVGLRPTISIVWDWHKVLDLGLDRGNWSPRVVRAIGDLWSTHRPLVFHVLSFTGRGQAAAHRSEALAALPSLEREAGVTFSSYNQCFERTGSGGKAELLHSLGPVQGQQPGAHYLVDDNRDIVKESRRTGCKCVQVVKPADRRFFVEQDLLDAIQQLSESLHSLGEERTGATGATRLAQSQYLEVIHR
ncbi:unnamed protein product [Symbiodinium sp. CCMP2592]|nr:unnamed protein product [Symbiodinium sp. CCMP2592]